MMKVYEGTVEFAVKCAIKKIIKFEKRTINRLVCIMNNAVLPFRQLTALTQEIKPWDVEMDLSAFNADYLTSATLTKKGKRYTLVITGVDFTNPIREDKGREFKITFQFASILPEHAVIKLLDGAEAVSFARGLTGQWEAVAITKCGKTVILNHTQPIRINRMYASMKFLDLPRELLKDCKKVKFPKRLSLDAE